MNNAVLGGTITKVPELRYLQDGQTAIAETVLKFPGFGKDAQDETIKAIVWGNQAQEFSNQGFVEGDSVIFEGRINLTKVDMGEYKEMVPEFSVGRYYRIGFTPASASPSPIAPPPTPPAAEPAKATAKAKGKTAEVAKAEAPVDEYDLAEIPF